MAKEKVIIYKDCFFDINKMKDPTHKVTSIHIDNFNEIIEFGITQGVTVNTTRITMQTAIDIGFINLYALERFIK